MANVILTFNFPLNVSVQVGDTAYYTKSFSVLGTHTHSNQNDIVQIGEITAIDKVNNTITCLFNPNPTGAAPPNSNDFIMFSKDNKVNLSSLTGYYAEAQFVNDSTIEAELFAVSTDVYGSSK